MEVELAVRICPSKSDSAGMCLSVANKSVEFTSPGPLLDSGFPVEEPVQFEFDNLYAQDSTTKDIYDGILAQVPDAFMNDKQNCVLYTYGQKATTKRQFLFGSSGELKAEPSESSGLIQTMLKRILDIGSNGSILKLQAFVLGVEDSVVDLFDLENTKPAVVSASNDTTVVENLSDVTVTDYTQVMSALSILVENVEDVFMDVMVEQPMKGSPEAEELAASRKKKLCECPCSPYKPSHIIFTLRKFDDQAAADEGRESNSIYCVVLGDSERPPMCGIHLSQLGDYQKAHKTHSAIVSMLGAIKTGRLRIPFTKSTLTSLVKKPYNQERGYSGDNAPTKSYIIIFAFGDHSHAEESYHSLLTGKRMNTLMGGGGVGPLSRDLEAEKWRLEADICRLKDELLIAKAVHDYKPAIWNQKTPVSDVVGEEEKRTIAIKKRREETKAREEADLRAKAQQEVQETIDADVAGYKSRISTYEKSFKEKLMVNSEMSHGRDKKVKEYQKQFDKNKKKKAEEEATTQNLIKDIGQMEDRVVLLDTHLAKCGTKLTALQEEEASMQAMMASNPSADVIKDTIEKNRQERESKMEAIQNEESKIEVDHSVSQSIADQFKGYEKTVEKNNAQKEEDEVARQKEMDAALNVYKAKASEHENKLKRDQLQAALKNQATMQGLIDQVVEYLQHGCRLVKIPTKGSSAKQRYFFISDDKKKVLACEMDELGMPINRQKPSTSINVKDIEKVVLGQFTQTFNQYGRAFNKNEWMGLMDADKGSYSPTPTPHITSSNAFKYFYRSFSFLFKDGKTLDLVTESDQDFEAWVVAMRSLVPEGSVVEWGGELDISEMSGSEDLDRTQKKLCSRSHIMPQQFIMSKQDAVAQYNSAGVLTVCDVRSCSTLDLARAHDMHQYLKDTGLIQ